MKQHNINTAAKLLRMRQVEHFRSLFAVTLPSQIKVSRARSVSFCVQLAVQLFCLHAARVFDYFVVIEITFMDNQALINETISRLDSVCVILARASGKLIFIHENKVFDCYFSLNLAETKT